MSSLFGGVGIGLKYITERVTGQLYPNTNPEETFTEHPQGEKKLANSLLKNLKNNVSLSQVSKQDGPMPVDEHTVKAKKDNSGGKVDSEKATLPETSRKIASVPPELPTLAEDVEMAQLTGTGKEQASGGASSDGMPVHYIERPISLFGKKESVYKKCHKFMTFGFADNIVLNGVDTTGNSFLTSYLAEIPWHIPAFYLNQSEFDLIPSGSKVKSVEIEVIYRGATIQFETGTTVTGLATLNQINDIAVAYGLNRTGWGSNVSYTAFDGSQPMLPSAIGKPKYAPVAGNYRGMVRDFYGSPNFDDNFRKDIPKHQTSRQCFLYNYWATSARGGLEATTANRQFGGWPCIAEKIQQMDGKTVVNQVVASSRYEPKLAPIKSPLKSQGHGLPFPAQNANITILTNGHLPGMRTATYQVPNNAPSSGGNLATTTEANVTITNSTEPPFNIYSPIEKCQMGKSGYWGQMDGHIQPSVHVGVQPVPALSSAALTAEDAVFNNWTDTRCYWEVIATMVVEEHVPTAWPYATVGNVPVGEVINWAPSAQRPAAIVDPRNDGATFASLYTNTSAPIE